MLQRKGCYSGIRNRETTKNNKQNQSKIEKSKERQVRIMKKMNNRKTTKVTKKARIGIAALAAIMTMSFAAPTAANAVTPYGSSNYSVVALTADDQPLIDVDGNKVIMDERLHAVTEMTAKTIFTVLNECTPYGKFVTPALETLLGSLIGTPEDPTQQKLDEINDKIDQIFTKLDTVQSSLEKAFKNELQMAFFYDSYVEFKTQTRNLSRKIKEITGRTTLSNEDKLAKIGSLIGKSSNWAYSFENSFSKFCEYITQSGLGANTSIFDVVYNRYCQEVMFSGEALDKAIPVCQAIMQNYTAGCTAILECLSAQLYINHLSAETRATIDSEYMNTICMNEEDLNDEIKHITSYLTGTSKEDAGKSIEAKYNKVLKISRYTVVNKGETDPFYTEGTLIVHDQEDDGWATGEWWSKRYKFAIEVFNKKFVHGNANNKSRVISRDIVKKMAEYANKKGMTIRELLNANGFRTDNLPKNTNFVTELAYGGSYDKYFGLRNDQKAWYKGINIDERGAKEKEIKFIHCGRDTFGNEWNYNVAGYACSFNWR